ncbi:SIR2 family protein [Nocardiopsis sp. NPDC049922]|uniref:SIR2 family protein n=1 Tax=Nocardiopsis sp. NPDC049922 TaxID=3155157 RepID=UPI0033D83C63
MEIVVLAGNGISIPGNPLLEMHALTDSLKKKFKEAAGEDGDAAQALASLSRTLTGDSASETANFEHLLGPLDSAAKGFADIGPLLRIARKGVDHTELERSMKTTSEFLRDLYRRGSAITLEQVVSAKGNEHTEKFIQEMLAIANGRKVDNIYLGTLNYDSLLHAALLGDHRDELCDLADGQRRSKEYEVIPGERPISGKPLRTRNNLPRGKRIAVLQMHGSAAWLRNPSGNPDVIRFPLRSLRNRNYWEALRDGRTEWLPEVVLTSQSGKLERIKERPFELAYSIFKATAHMSKSILIIGYGFRDRAVNEALQAVVSAEDPGQEKDILVVTKGADPTTEEIKGVLMPAPREGGYVISHQEPIICRCGIPDTFGCDKWVSWVERIRE